MDWLFGWGNPNACGFVSPVDSWPLMSTVAVPLILIAVYFGFLTRLGPQYMGNRAPFRLQTFIDRFNQAMCVLHLILGIAFSVYITQAEYSLWCQPVYHHSHCGSVDPIEEKIAMLAWGYFVLKLAGLADGVISTLRRNRMPIRLTAHHCTMVFMGWMFAKYLPGGTSAVFATVNCFTHVATYGYFELASRRLLARGREAWPSIRKVDTCIQLTQFGLVAAVARIAWSASKNGTCSYPGWATDTICGAMFLFAGMLIYDETMARLQPTGASPKRSR